MPKIIKHYQLVILILVILVAIFFRFWQIRDYVVFLGDEGRDMIVMRDIFVKKHLPFLGPTASVGGFYLGPIYYWMAAPFLLLANFDPVGPAYFVAALGVATVFLLYKFLKEEISFWPAVISSFLYATAPLIVRYSRSSWNQNPLPFFSLLLIYFLYLAIKKQKLILGPQSTGWWKGTANYAYYLLAGACFGVAIQLHYMALLLAPIASLIVLVNTRPRVWFLSAVILIIGSLFTFSPFLIFEIRHNFPNFRTILEFVTRGTTVGYEHPDLANSIANAGNILIEDLMDLYRSPITRIIFWFLAIGGLIALFKHWKNSEKKLIFSIATIWFLGGLAGIRLYQGQLYDYYFGFMFPAPFFLIGVLFSTVWQKLPLRLLCLLMAILATTYFAFHSFYRIPPNKLIEQTSYIADFVIEKSDGEPFNFALISDHNSDHAYKYFLQTKNGQPLELETMVTNQLLIVCESKKCEPLGHPLWEIAAFGRGEISGEWNLEKYGIKIFRLTHWPGEPSPAGKPAVKGG